MNPAEELRAAAAKLRELAAKASKDADGAWSTERYWWKTRSVAMPDQWMCAVTDEYGHVAISSEVDDAADGSSAADRVAWIALMGPDKAELLAVWLESSAKTAEAMFATWQRSALELADPHALAFARSILGEASWMDRLPPRGLEAP